MYSSLLQGRGLALKLGMTGVVVYLTMQLLLSISSHKGRRLLVSSWRRLTRWEFWPMWLFYAPVALWTIWLALRYRGFGTIAAANPGMPDGGIVGESKFEILSRLPAESTIPSAALDPGTRQPPGAVGVRTGEAVPRRGSRAGREAARDTGGRPDGGHCSRRRS